MSGICWMDEGGKEEKKEDSKKEGREEENKRFMVSARKIQDGAFVGYHLA